MKQYFRFFPILFLLIHLSCEKYNNDEVEKSREDLQLKTVTINSPNELFLSDIKSDTVIHLEERTIYNMHVPIILNDIQNLTFYGNGAKLNFLFNGVAIEMDSCKYINISDLTISNDNGSYYSDSIKGRFNISSSEYIEIDNITMKRQKVNLIGNALHQLQFYRSKYCSVKSSVFHYSTGELICLRGSESCIVENNVTANGWSGIADVGLIEDSSYFGYRNRIINNQVTDCEAAMITINARETTVEGNTIYSTTSKGGPGIRFGHGGEEKRALNCICRNNTISNLVYTDNEPYKPIAIYLNYTTDVNEAEKSNTLIDNNLITKCHIGVQVSVSGGQTGIISNNRIHSISRSIILYSGTQPQNFAIEDNELNATGDDGIIRIWNSSAIVNNNSITYDIPNQKVIEISHTTSNENIRITENTMHLSQSYGVYQSGSLKNLYVANNDINGAYIGMLLQCNESLVINNDINLCQQYGIQLIGSNNTSILKNNISSVLKSSIYLKSTSTCKIQDNYLSYLDGEHSYAVWENNCNNNDIGNNILVGYLNEKN